MENEIIKYLSKYMTISKEIEETIIESDFIRSYKKGTVLLEEGKISNECYFIIKGCIRSYYVKDGNEMTTDFFTECTFRRYPPSDSGHIPPVCDFNTSLKSLPNLPFFS